MLNHPSRIDHPLLPTDSDSTHDPPIDVNNCVEAILSVSTREKAATVAVKLRLMRMGKKKQPTYRVVAADARSPRNGRFIEIIGTYEPRQDPSIVNLDNDRALHWLRQGAQPTERVEKILKVSGAWDSFKGLPVGTSVGSSPAPTAVVPTPAGESAPASAEGAVAIAQGGQDS